MAKKTNMTRCASSGNYTRVEPAPGGGDGIKVEKIVLSDSDRSKLSIGTARLPAPEHGDKPK